jgi:hypothetical protein
VSQETARLEELLARVQRNAALPRAGRVVAVASAKPVPVAAAAAPLAFSPPVVVPEPVFSPPPAPVVVPEPVFSPPPPAAYSPPAYTPPVQTFTDSVDDLLEDPFPASSAPPPPPTPIQDLLEDEPMPSVATAPASEHISGVMPVAEISDEAPEELLEDDIVEMSPAAAPVEVVVPAARPSIDEVDLNFDDEDEAPAARQSAAEEEEPPASSSRSKIPATMDEALAHAAEHLEMQEGREVPLKTPPPESGPQAAMAPLPAGIHAPPAPDIDELLEADILPAPAVLSPGPTTEQLGQTIDLEEARGPHLELDHPVPAAAAAIAAAPTEELEITLPQREFGGGYQDDLMPPPEARQDLDAHLQRVGDDAIPPPPESLGQLPSIQPSARVSGLFASATPAVTTESPTEAVSTVTIEAPSNAEFSPELLARPDISPSPVAKFIRAEAPRPSTFLELLDASLTLGRD